MSFYAGLAEIHNMLVIEARHLELWTSNDPVKLFFVLLLL